MSTETDEGASCIADVRIRLKTEISFAAIGVSLSNGRMTEESIHARNIIVRYIHELHSYGKPVTLTLHPKMRRVS